MKGNPGLGDAERWPVAWIWLTTRQPEMKSETLGQERGSQLDPQGAERRHHSDSPKHTSVGGR
ncbi:hypothetical protein GOODEAATRI_020998, partial [Goodea atripinnis]